MTKTLKFKTLCVFSNGSSYYSYLNILKYSNSLLFYEKDYIESLKKDSSTKTKLKYSNEYKNKYLN